jgi:hypothetical protein
MNKPVRTTIVFALASGIFVVPAVELLSVVWSWPMAFKLMLWADLAVYAVLLSRWSRTPPWQLLFPLAVLLGTALWPHAYSGFFILAVGVFSWIRSGICFDGRPLRSLLAEGATIAGAVLLLMFFGGHTPIAWAVSICLFYLVQSLFFFFVPVTGDSGTQGSDNDPFEQAAVDVQHLMDGFR